MENNDDPEKYIYIGKSKVRMELTSGSSIIAGAVPET